MAYGRPTSHYLTQWWLVYWRIYASFGLHELIYNVVFQRIYAIELHISLHLLSTSNNSNDNFSPVFACIVRESPHCSHVADLSVAEQVPAILVFGFQYVRWHLYIETAPRMSKFSWPYDRLKIKSCCDAKFVVTVSTAGCRYDNPLWYQWWQSWHPMTWFSVFIISLVDHHCFGMILCHRYNPICYGKVYILWIVLGTHKRHP